MIVVTAYIGYKGMDDLGLFASDVFGFDDVRAARSGELALGLLSDLYAGEPMNRHSILSICAAATAALSAGCGAPPEPEPELDSDPDPGPPGSWYSPCPVEEREQRMLDVGEVSLNVACRGEGPTIVFLHGFPEFHYGWDAVMDELVQDYRLIAPDQRGYNLSDKPEDVEAYMDFFRNPGSEDFLTSDFLAEQMMGFLSPEDELLYREAWEQPGAITGGLNWYRANDLSVEATDAVLAELSPTISVPVSVLWGLDDDAVLASNAEGLEAYAPDLEVSTFEGVDHWIEHRIPGEVAEALRALDARADGAR
jgi:pimeloyl-ACP methyl ester carboxylesterase